MAKNNNVETHKNNTKIENEKSSELKPKERTKKKIRLHSHLRVNIPLFPSLMMILPSLAKHAAAEDTDSSGDTADQVAANNVTEKDVNDDHTKADSSAMTHQETQISDSDVSSILSASHAPHGSSAHLVPSHHLSTLSHPQVHYIPSVSMPTISAVSNGQPTHSNVPATPVLPVTFKPEVIKGTYGELHVDVNGQYTFVLNPKSPQYILLNQHQQGTDHFLLHLSNGSSVIVQVPVTGKQDTPCISGDLTGVVTEDHNIDSQGLLHANGKIDVIDPDQNESSVTPEVISGKYGSLTIDADGHWLYQVDNSLSNVQALTAATSLHESFTIHTKDGTPQTIDMTIGGNDDNAVITGIDTGTVTEDLTTQAQGKLSVTDPDLGEDHFHPSQINGHLGTLTITKDGSWTYDLDNTNPTVQALGKGATATDTITVHSADGTPQQVTVTINGTNDRPTISGTSIGSVIEQGLNTAGTPDATGSLIATDLDKSDTITWAINQPQGQWGTLSIDQHGHWHYQLDSSTGGPADKLAAGEHQSESFWITATDSAGATVPHKIVINVQGSNDKPIVSAWTQLPAGKEDQPVTIKASDLLTHASDVDSGDVLQLTNLQATHGNLTDNKDGTYTFTPDKDFNGEIRLTYDVVDGHGGSVSTQAKFDLTASPDNAIITDVQTNIDLRGVTEDRGYIDTHYQLHYDGRLNIQDPDTGEAHFDPNIGPQTYQGIGYDTKLGGHILLMRDGHYTYTLDNRNIQNLAQGEVKHDSAVIRSADGTTHTIELTVHGTNDAPIINAQSHSVTEDGQLLTGQMQGHDIDHGATLTYSIAQAVDGLTFNPDGSYSFDPSHPSYQSLVQGQTQTLIVPVTVTDEHGANATKNLEIMVTGSNDGAQISGTDTGDVYESTYTDRSPDYQRGNISHLWNDHIHTSGKLDIFDSDAGEAHFDNNAPAYQYFGQYGRLILQPDGNWYYHVDVGDSAIGRKIDALNTGENLTDTITIRSADGTTHDVVITIHGDNDSPFASSEVQLNSGKEDNAQTVTEAQLLANSMDVDTSDAGKLHVDSLQVDHGSIRDNQDGTYTFTPEKDYNGQVHFTYDVKDAHSGVTHTGATMHLVPVGDAATISGTDSGSITEDRHVFPDSMHHIQVTGSLSISDPDAGEDHFRASGAFGHEKAISDPFQGEMHIDRYGNWDYVLANGNPAVQALKQGETKDVIYEVRSADGTPHRITITVTGTNDAPTLAAQTHNVTEDGQRLSGQMHGHDIDHRAVLTYSISHPIDGLTFHSDGSYSFDPSHSSYQHLAAGQQQTVTVPVTVTDEHGDSATEQLVLTVTGTNNAPIVSPITDSVTEDSDKHHQFDLLQGAKDVEGDSLSIGQIQCTYHGQTSALPAGVRFAPDGHTLVVDATDSNFQHLAAGEKETIVFHYQVIDSHGAATAQTATITVVGTDDKAQLVTSNINLTEGEALKTYQHISDVSGHLSLTDPDSHDNTHFEFNIVQGSQNVGVLTIWPDGQYRYYVDPARNHNAHYAVNSLKSGETLTEHFQVKTSDGQTKDIAVTIHGEDNQAHLQVVDPKLLPVDPHLYEDKTSFRDPNKLYAGGIVRVHDPDHDDAQAIAHTETSSHGGHFQVGSSGGWSYTIDNNSPQVQNLGAGESFTDSFTIRSKDGSASQVISVTVHGTNDNPIVTSQVQLPSSTEDHASTITVAQLLANSSDIDSNDAGQLSIANLVADHGSIRDNHDGTFTFTPDKDYNGQVHFTYDVKDAHGGVTQTGATLDLAVVDDKTVISGVSQGAATEDVGTPMATHVNIMDAVDWQALQITDVDSANTRVTVEFAGQRYTWDLGCDLDIITPYGKFQFHTITSGPHIGEHAWSYIGDNNNIHVQELKHGESLTESIKLIATDGTEFPISVTVNGTEDGVVIDSKSELGHVIEDSQTAISGSVTAHDTDLHDTVSWAQTPTGGVLGHYGTFHLSSDGQWHYDLDQSKAEQLGDGDEYWEHFTVEAISTDGSRVSKSVSVVVHGSNDAPTVSGEVTLPSGKEDSSIHITQTQLIANATDTDLNDRGWLHAQNLTADHGSITSNSDGSFTFKPDPNYHGAVHFSYDIADRHGGVTHTGANMTLTPEKDPSVLVGTGQATLTEDHTQGSSSTLWSGWLQLDIKDPDGPSDGKIVGIEVNGVVHQVPANFALTLRTHLGYFSTTHSTDGHNKWSYSADNSNPEIQGLKAGEQLHESMTLITADGTHIPITATINGEEDHVVIDTPVATLASLGTAIEDTTTRIVGQLQAHDVDIHDSVSYVQTSLVGKYGTFHLDSTGAWHYDLDHSRANHLAAGEMKAEGFDITATSSDGSQVSQHIELYVQGSNDAPQVTEVNQGTAPLGSHSIDEDGSASVQGQILITDVDHSDQHSVVVDAHNQPQYGHVSYDTQTNTWTYVLDNANPTVNALNSGDDLTDKFSLIVDDGHGGSATKEIEMTIHGHSDTPPTPTLVAPAQITGSAGHQDLHASLGIPPLIHQAVPHMQTGWGILTGGGHVVSSLQGQFGTLHVNAQTGELTYDYQTSSGVIKTHTGGSYGSGTDETDSFILTLAGTQNSQVSVHLHLHSQSVHGASGHHIDQTTLTGIDVSPLNAPPPPPPVASDEISPITPENDNVDIAGVDVYLDALGITSLTDHDTHDSQQQSPQDLDIVLSDPAHDPNSLNPDDGGYQIDVSEQLDHDLDDINPDDHHNHNDPANFIDPS